ncbi:TPA: SocA family protein [Vibrio vulnificus]|uniref:Panacea domain-containing protein n=1 Tax=Vibrio vulnificus TaxID=672 RepID=UPI001D74D3E5|nr:DUF4065 domain-containing protein [Vibrio vulnificus]EGR0106843.1 DUF4065 domain-containing protein [Vibrio vulnificus]EHH0795976.1 SocA family protein [Vibrio vulnificus]EIA1300320.1 SocA family protein [Vibrio vulnificus]EIO4079123.1 SocA family protein [Vibrio vulnificus]
MGQFSAKAIANAFYDLAKAEGQFICPMKMQKLVYIAHGWSLGLLDKPLIQEQVQAWKYGPVINELYHEFKIYGSGNITRKATSYMVDPNNFEVVESTPEVNDSQTQQLLKIVWDTYKKFSGGQLSNMTHESGTPWDKTFNGMRSVVVDNQTIQQHYKELIQKRAQA